MKAEQIDWQLNEKNNISFIGVRIVVDIILLIVKCIHATSLLLLSMSHLNPVDIITELIKDLIEARESIAGWAAYANDHFQEKHDLVGELNYFSKKISLAQDLLKQLQEATPEVLKQGDFISVEDLEKAWND